MLGVNVFCKEKHWLQQVLSWLLPTPLVIQVDTFFTPPKVMSLERTEGRRPGEMVADGRRPARTPLPLPPGLGTCWPLFSPDPKSAILN